MHSGIICGFVVLNSEINVTKYIMVVTPVFVKHAVIQQIFVEFSWSIFFFSKLDILFSK